MSPASHVLWHVHLLMVTRLAPAGPSENGKTLQPSQVFRLRISLKLFHWFLQIVVVASPEQYAQKFLFVLLPKISKHYDSYKSQPKIFKLFLNFLRNGRYKTTFGIFEILKIEIYSFSLTYGSLYGSLRSLLFQTIEALDFSIQWLQWWIWNFRKKKSFGRKIQRKGEKFCLRFGGVAFWNFHSHWIPCYQIRIKVVKISIFKISKIPNVVCEDHWEENLGKV